MTTPKILVAYYSTYGTNHAVADEAARAAREAGAEVRLRRFAETAPEAVVNTQDAWKDQLAAHSDIPDLSHDDLDWADGYFFSMPTRYGNVPSQVRSFIDTCGPIWQEGKLANKVVTATTSAGNAHGGQEATILSFYTTIMHWGSLIVAPGYTDPAVGEAGGNPYGTSIKAGAFDDAGRAAVAHQSRRLTEFATRLVATA
ncbi:NAD(P)H:quinone oxidoreductase [Pseudooceanicola aestuarii]|uniref:NAD(P)H:quinone oxidoreductase n=1 Tax=Pseudooceanicola aestuarii TaxID=2697319 RepID=UPI0013D659B8|nr:NAD(P)H:quinone oxidoreductase [Pseudooceanicola aestuarii]